MHPTGRLNVLAAQLHACARAVLADQHHDARQKDQREAAEAGRGVRQEDYEYTEPVDGSGGVSSEFEPARGREWSWSMLRLLADDLERRIEQDLRRDAERSAERAREVGRI